MIITEIEGDLFTAPDNAVLIHACNCIGSWGGGIAKAFKSKYPAAYKIYHAHCRDAEHAAKKHTIIDTQTGQPGDISLPLGTALVIPPQASDVARAGVRHYIVCLFTSYAFGRSVSKPHEILENSVHAIRDMKKQIENLQQGGSDIARDGRLYSCRFNSGLFRVKWEDTKAVLEREMTRMEAIQEIVVVRPEGQE